MPRDITVTFEDGSSHVYKNAPDDLTPEAVTARASQEFGKPVTGLDGGKEASFIDDVVRKGKVAGSAAVRGFLGIPALLGEVAGAAARLETPNPANIFLPESVQETKPGDVMRTVAKFGTQAETSGEKWLASGAEGVGGAVTGGGVGGVVRQAVIGAGSGLGAEAGGRLSGDNPLGRLVGGLAGGVGTGMATGLANKIRPQTADLAREAMEGLDEGMLLKAQQLQASARAQGVDMDLAQALEAVGAPASNLTTLRNVLANSRHGTNVQQVVRQQPGQLELLADTKVAGLPGPVLDPLDAANRVQIAATGAINSAKATRSAAVRPLYEAAGELPPEARQKLLAAINLAADKPGATDALQAAANELRRKLGPKALEAKTAVLEAQKAIGTATTPKARAQAVVNLRELLKEAAVPDKPLHALDVDTALADAMGTYKGTPLSPANPKAVGQVKGLGVQVNKTLQGLSPELRKAEQEFARLSDELVNPLKQGVVGTVATRRGALPDVQASVAKLDAIFSGGSDSQVADAAKSIPKLFNELKKVDPEAVPAAAKAFLRGRLDKAFGNLPGETVQGAISSEQAAKVLYTSLFEKRGSGQAMRDMVAGIARSYDLPEVEMVRGFENFVQITRGLASRPDKVGGLNWKDVAQAGGKSQLADVARVYGFLPFEKVARGIEDRTLAKTFTEFDRILTTPEGAQLLLTLSKTPIMSNKAIAALATFGGTAGAVAPDKLGQ